MPVKGQMNKTRTAKTKGKGLKLKWWYVLPVIAIVAVAGYLVIRYSQAGATARIRGGFGTFNKNGTKLTRATSGIPVRAIVQGGQYVDGKKACVRIWVSAYSAAAAPNLKWAGAGHVTVQPYVTGSSTEALSQTSSEALNDIAASGLGSIGGLSISQISRVDKPAKATPSPVQKNFTGYNQWKTECVRIPKTSVSNLKQYRPKFAIVKVYTDIPADSVKYPVGVQRIWLEN